MQKDQYEDSSQSLAQSGSELQSHSSDTQPQSHSSDNSFLASSDTSKLNEQSIEASPVNQSTHINEQTMNTNNLSGTNQGQGQKQGSEAYGQTAHASVQDNQGGMYAHGNPPVQQGQYVAQGQQAQQGQYVAQDQQAQQGQPNQYSNTAQQGMQWGMSQQPQQPQQQQPHQQQLQQPGAMGQFAPQQGQHSTMDQQPHQQGQQGNMGQYTNHGNMAMSNGKYYANGAAMNNGYAQGNQANGSAMNNGYAQGNQGRGAAHGADVNAGHANSKGLLALKSGEWSSNLSMHILMIAIISILLLIPTLFFTYVLDDRMDNQEYAVDSIVEPWGYSQHFGDPNILLHMDVSSVFKVEDDSDEKKIKVEDKIFMAIASKSDSQVNIDFEKRYRGNYEATLYKTTVVQEGYIDLARAIGNVVSDNSSRKVSLNAVEFFVPVSYSRAIDDIKSITLNGKAYMVESIMHNSLNGFGVTLLQDDIEEILAGSNISKVEHDLVKGSKQSTSSIASNVPALKNTFDADAERVNEDNTAVATVGRMSKATDPGMVRYRVEYVLRGSQKLLFRPLGQSTTTAFKGEWSNPSYTGSFLPSERTSDEKTFSATYLQNNIATALPLVLDTEKLYLFSSDDSYCLDFSNSITFYTLIDRLTKYVLLFISMCFVTVLACEIVMSRMVSLAQYVVIGVALIMFYMVLLALSEHTSFTFAYICASLLMSVMISLYLKAALNSKRSALAVCIMLLAMYAVLFAIVHIEAYALLVGTILLIAMLGIVMYITRRINVKVNF
ncbi:cell envelope integrity protein CreD [Anaerobiospirillum succiniciproducens]|uniref:cell envelope integrity protein CreD n=1 Tax=Anaerobiospirillum succiniciproducens TaxID=13335 RepID=UPI00235313DE|nr:cell envelope integrity protein CreD [Anaerobiospirillum succiniciproducens]MCI6862634.1 cell envelope integrity protein CreD [Anaerobiospirillum succiniciproducens]